MASRVGRVLPPHNPHGFRTQQEIGRDRAIARNVARRLNGTPTPVDSPDDQPRGPIVIRDPESPASDKQKGLMFILCGDLAKLDADKAHQARTWAEAVIEKDEMTKDLASRTITRLRERIAEAREVPEEQRVQIRPPITPARDLFPDIPDGYYAVESTTEGQDLSFYRVSMWKDSVNRKVQIQAGPNWHPVRRTARDDILARIRAAGVEKAGKKYADELGRCYACNLQLTDEESRAVGKGPVCRNK